MGLRSFFVGLPQNQEGITGKKHLIQGVSILYKIHKVFLEDTLMEKKDVSCYNDSW